MKLPIPAARTMALGAALLPLLAGTAMARAARMTSAAIEEIEKQVTSGAGGRILTNANVWSPEGQWIVYDVRSDAEGALFDGSRIEMVNVRSGQVRRLYESKNGAYCGVATFHPKKPRVAFILGPENPTPDWEYGPSHRQGVIVDVARAGQITNLDARDLTPPLTPGALRGGSHVHIWSPDGESVSFTYNDALLPSSLTPMAGGDIDQRNIGISVPLREVRVSRDHARNHGGKYFSVLVTHTVSPPRPGSDDIQRAFEESWIGANGYVRADGQRQKRALAFQGEVLSAEGKPISEVFVVDVPDDVSKPSPDGPLEGTLSRRPLPPLGTMQRRLTFTASRKFPGIQGPRHWLRSSPDGAQIAFLMRDHAGVAQLWSISPNGGEPRQITRDAWGVASAFSWSCDGKRIAYAGDNSIFVAEAATGESVRLTPRSPDADAPLGLACVFSPDGKSIAYGRRVPDSTAPDAARSNQIFVVSLPRAVRG